MISVWIPIALIAMFCLGVITDHLVRKAQQTKADAVFQSFGPQNIDLTRQLNAYKLQEAYQNGERAGEFSRKKLLDENTAIKAERDALAMQLESEGLFRQRVGEGQNATIRVLPRGQQHG